MNTKLLASIAVFALLTSVAVSSQFAFADEAKKDEMKAKKDAKAAEMKAKKDAKAAEMKAKKDAKAAEMKAKKDAKAAEMKAKKEEVKAKVAEKKESAGTPSGDVVVDMAKGTATNTECGDQCYVPNNVQIAVGGTVIWKNVDSAAHTATDVNGAFDSYLVNAGKSFKHKFDAAGTYEYMCIVHPWMKGTVTVS
jgi:plastocyanin